MAIAIYKNGPSNGAVTLKNALGATLLKSEGSSFRPRADKLLINWGSSGAEARRLCGLQGNGRVMNRPEAVAIATNKLTTFQRLREANVSIVPYYTRLQDALGHAEGGRIYARTRLQGSGGEGIHMILHPSDAQAEEARSEDFPYPVTFLNDDEDDMPDAPLYTVGITGRRKEWRIHVVDGQVILSQLKQRRQGFQDNENYTSLVRNVEAGWIYSVNFNRTENAECTVIEQLAIQAIQAIGLDFGAVDIVSKGNTGYVLEVNTAPGLSDEGSALQAYTNAFTAAHQAIRRSA